MRVLDTCTGDFVDVDLRGCQTKYAILSHTWERGGEQTYQDLLKLQKRYQNRAYRGWRIAYLTVTGLPSKVKHRLHQNNLSPLATPLRPLSPIWGDSQLSPKIREACRVARENGYRYLWIDSCCIDKTSSAELSESINSMYQWYARSSVCYAFLPDVSSEEDHRRGDSHFRHSRWFTRGWTLQELIAPVDVQFLSRQWTFIGSKHSLAELVVEITNIQYNALLHIELLDEFSVAQRLSWAADRKTTRVEDEAYSLLGIFDINMPTVYGEGEQAFQRLQEEIMRRTPDQSLFAWTDARLPDPWSRMPIQNPNSTDTYGQNAKVTLIQRSGRPFLAPSPASFKYSTDIKSLSHDEVARRLQLDPDNLPTTDYDFTPHGIRTRLPVISITDYLPSARISHGMADILRPSWYFVILGCEHRNFPGHLLGRFCCIQSSGSSARIESADSQSINIGGGHCELLPLSPTTITRIHSSRLGIPVKTLHIPRRNRDQGTPAVDIACRKQHRTIKLILLEKTRRALSVQGYTTTLCGPDDASPRTHTIVLSHSTHAITIDYHHTLFDLDGPAGGTKADQQWIIDANVNVWGLASQDLQVDGIDTVPTGTQVSWQDVHDGWWEEEFSLEEVVLNLPGGDPVELTVRLGLTFATVDHYILCIELKTADGSSSAHGDVVRADVSGQTPCQATGPNGDGNTSACYVRGY